MGKVCDNTGRKYDDTPLTEEQKARASDPMTLRIPTAMAKRHCRGFEENFERLYGFAVTAYVKCARSFKVHESPQGESGWPGYAAHWVEISMLTQEGKYQGKMARIPTISLDAPYSDKGGETFADSVPDYREPVPIAEVHEETDKILKKLRGKERAATSLYLKEGMTYAEASKKLGVTRERVRQLVNTAMWRIRMSYAKIGQPKADIRAHRIKWVEENPRKVAASYRKMRKASKKACRQRALARIAMGLVSSVGWYIADPNTKTLVGPYPHKEDCLAAIPPTPDGVTGVIAENRARKAAGLPYPLENSNARRRGKEGWKAEAPEGFTPEWLETVIATRKC